MHYFVGKASDHRKEVWDFVESKKKCRKIFFTDKKNPHISGDLQEICYSCVLNTKILHS